MSRQSICRSCCHHLGWQRGFSSTANQRALGPESPAFVHVPKPVQPPKSKSSVVKGVLPIARPLFPKRKEYRATNEYLDQATPLPKEHNEPHGPEADRIRWDKKMSSVRRQSLREGMSELWSRHETTKAERNKGGAFKQIRSRQAAVEPDPSDQTLTNPTMHPSVRLMLAINNAPIPKKQKKNMSYEKRQRTFSDRRKESLHNLYVNAQHFIVNEEQLNAEIEKVFGSDEFPIRFNEGNSVWSLTGANSQPRTVSGILREAQEGSGKLADKGAQQRLQRIAETLTGGKTSSIGGPRTSRSAAEAAAAS